MKIKISKTSCLSEGSALVFPFFENEKEKKELQKEISKNIKDISLPKSITCPLKKTKNWKQKLISLNDSRYLMLLNLGDREKWNLRKFRLAIRNVVLFLKSNEIKESCIFIENIIPDNYDFKNALSEIAQNAKIAEYEFVKFKKSPKEGWFKINSFSIFTSKKIESSFNEAIKEGEIIAESVNLCRDLANIPGGDMTPAILAKETKKAIKNTSINAEIFNISKIKKLKMGGIIGVSNGSKEAPKLIILDYKGNKNSKKTDIVYVGKGVTFDSGGINLKPSNAMSEMWMDMSGGAAVIASLIAISKLKIPLNIIGIIPAVENMPSGESLRPGDIIKSFCGKTIEVENTDAEGRIILADAINFGIKKYKPKFILDIATLTGACMVALGQRASGLFTNSEKNETTLRKIGENSGDYVWPLPCWEEYEEEIKGIVGDILNLAKSPFGGAITAALFLKNFCEEKPWAHIDISPTMTSIENQGLAKGATGAGVRYLIQFAKNFKNIERNL